jgi:hypothetical protein
MRHGAWGELDRGWLVRNREQLTLESQSRLQDFLPPSASPHCQDAGFTWTNWIGSIKCVSSPADLADKLQHFRKFGSRSGFRQLFFQSFIQPNWAGAARPVSRCQFSFTLTGEASAAVAVGEM